MKTTTKIILGLAYPILEEITECTEKTSERILLEGMNVIFDDEIIEKDCRQEMRVPAGAVDLMYPRGTFPASAEKACDFYITRISFINSSTGEKRKLIIHGKEVEELCISTTFQSRYNDGNIKLPLCGKGHDSFCETRVFLNRDYSDAPVAFRKYEKGGRTDYKANHGQARENLKREILAAA